MAELSKLLTFVRKEDKQKILQHYNELLDNAEDERAMLESFGSPTKLAVTISRSYDRDHPITAAPEAPPAETAETPAEAEVPESEAESIPPEELSPSEEAAPLEEAVIETEDAPDESVSLEPSVPTKTSTGLLILYLIFAIPIGLALLLVITGVNLILLIAGLTVASATVAAFGFAFSGLTVLADMLVVLGASIILLALAVLLLWLAVWLIIVSYRGLFRGLKRLGVRICVKEVADNG